MERNATLKAVPINSINGFWCLLTDREAYQGLEHKGIKYMVSLSGDPDFLEVQKDLLLDLFRKGVESKRRIFSTTYKITLTARE